MRTTLTIDDDLGKAIERLRRRKNLSLRAAIDHLLRAGLQATETTARSRSYDGAVFESELRPGIDPNRLNQLADVFSSSRSD